MTNGKLKLIEMIYGGGQSQVLPPNSVISFK